METWNWCFARDVSRLPHPRETRGSPARVTLTDCQSMITIIGRHARLGGSRRHGCGWPLAAWVGGRAVMRGQARSRGDISATLPVRIRCDLESVASVSHAPPNCVTSSPRFLCGARHPCSQAQATNAPSLCCSPVAMLHGRWCPRSRPITFLRDRLTRPVLRRSFHDRSSEGHRHRPIRMASHCAPRTLSGSCCEAAFCSRGAEVISHSEFATQHPAPAIRGPQS